MTDLVPAGRDSSLAGEEKSNHATERALEGCRAAAKPAGRDAVRVPEKGGRTPRVYVNRAWNEVGSSGRGLPWPKAIPEPGPSLIRTPSH